MNTSKFELTEEEIDVIIFQSSTSVLDKFDTARKIRQAQVAKVFSLLEPMELEALGDEEMKPLYKKYGCSLAYKEVSQATIQHNQAKGRLFRLKER